VVDVGYDAKVPYIFHIVVISLSAARIARLRCHFCFYCAQSYYFCRETESQFSTFHFQFSIFMNVIKKYASLVKFPHTVFALPFALISYFYAAPAGGGFDWLMLLEVLLCMVFARNAAMGFNRWADRRIDARNPRTASREIPSGKISPRAGLVFVVVNAVLFVVTAGLVNRLALMLSPAALIIILGYSYTKRFTWLSHFVLGLALAIAPAGAWIAVTERLDTLPVLLGFLVLTWVGGFDILYSLQDRDFDRRHGLHSVPARFSAEQSLGISLGVHLATLAAAWAIGRLFTGDLPGGILYWIGAAIFAALTMLQHILVTPKHLDRIGAIFGLVNGLSSLVYAGFFIAASF
jgi:4-hydroxybenzoate polyprenyltransferase